MEFVKQQEDMLTIDFCFAANDIFKNINVIEL